MTLKPHAPAREFDRLALLHKINDIRRIYVPYEKLGKIKGSVVDLIDRDNSGSQGNIQVILGPSRSGKTRFIEDLMRDYPVEREAILSENNNWADRKTVVFTSVADAKDVPVAEGIYKSLSGRSVKDVLGSKIKIGDIKEGIKMLAVECGMKLLILDEAHQSIDNKTDTVAKNVAILIKDLVNDKKFSILLVGTDETMRLVRAREEVRKRTTHVHRIKPFGANPHDRTVWNEILQDIDDDLSANVFEASSGLTAPDMSSALMAACSGILGEMTTLMEQAAILALDEMIHAAALTARDKAKVEPPGIKWRHLEEAFAVSAIGFDAKVNPFSLGARPPPEGLPDVAPEETVTEEDEVEGPASGVRGRKRAKHRASKFSK